MAKKITKATKKASKTTKYDPKPVLRHPSTWIAAVLLLALLVIYGVSVYGFNHIEPKTNLDIAKLEIFDSLAAEHLQNQEITTDKPSVKEITGYGISDEDGAFYITFDYTTYNVNDPSNPIPDEPKHAIMYFWKDKERGTYSHAFSYHEDDYHPGGTYVKVKSE